MTFDLVLRSFLDGEGKRFRRRAWLSCTSCGHALAFGVPSVRWNGLVFRGVSSSPLEMKHDNATQIGWEPSTADIFADDWEEVRE